MIVVTGREDKLLSIKNKLKQKKHTSVSAASSYFDFLPGIVRIRSNRPSSSIIFVPKADAWSKRKN